MDPLELLEVLDERIRQDIQDMGDALGHGACMNRENVDRAYANCVGRVEGWEHVRSLIDEIRQKYVDA